MLVYSIQTKEYLMHSLVKLELNCYNYSTYRVSAWLYMVYRINILCFSVSGQCRFRRNMDLYASNFKMKKYFILDYIHIIRNVFINISIYYDLT